jgi:hypothetical protein
MDLEDRINNCRLFCDGICPHAEKMERAYLAPQLLKPEVLRKYEALCRACKHCDESAARHRDGAVDAFQS